MKIPPGHVAYQRSIIAHVGRQRLVLLGSFLGLETMAVRAPLGVEVPLAALRLSLPLDASTRIAVEGQVTTCLLRERVQVWEIRFVRLHRSIKRLLGDFLESRGSAPAPEGSDEAPPARCAGTQRSSRRTLLNTPAVPAAAVEQAAAQPSEKRDHVADAMAGDAMPGVAWRP